MSRQATGTRDPGCRIEWRTLPIEEVVVGNSIGSCKDLSVAAGEQENTRRGDENVPHGEVVDLSETWSSAAQGNNADLNRALTREPQRLVFVCSADFKRCAYVKWSHEHHLCSMIYQVARSGLGLRHPHLDQAPLLVCQPFRSASTQRRPWRCWTSRASATLDIALRKYASPNSQRLDGST